MSRGDGTAAADESRGSVVVVFDLDHPVKGRDEAVERNGHCCHASDAPEYTPQAGDDESAGSPSATSTSETQLIAPSPAEDVRPAASVPQHETRLLPRLAAGLFAALGGGANVLVVQLGAIMSKYSKNPLRSSFIHFSLSTVLLFLVFLVMRNWRLADRASFAWPEFKKWGWKAPLPGMCGASYIAAGMALTPVIGYGSYLGFFIFGQIASSLVLDHKAILGAPHNPATPARIIAVAVICAAVAVAEGFNPSNSDRAWWAILLLSVGSTSSGVPAPFQALLNRSLTQRYGTPLTGAMLSFCGGAIWMGLLSAIALSWSSENANFGDAPWYCWCSPLAGSIYVTSTCICPKYLGASLFFTSVVCGQLAASMLIDGVKLFPNTARPVTWQRGVSVAVIVLAVGALHILYQRMIRRQQEEAAAAAVGKTSEGSATETVTEVAAEVDVLDLDVGLVAAAPHPLRAPAEASEPTAFDPSPTQHEPLFDDEKS